MQLTISFSPCAHLPLAYQRPLQGLLYTALGANPAYQSFLHGTGYAIGSRTFRHFCFGRLRGRYVQKGMEISFPKGMALTVRSTDGRFMQLLVEAMAEGTVHRLANSQLTVLRAELSDQRIVTDEALITMDSPIVVCKTQEDGSTCFPEPFDPEFTRLLAMNAGRKWASLYDTDPPGSFALLPLEVTPQDKVVTRYQNFCLTGWRGKYALHADPRVLDLLYQTGLGSRNAQGFGLFDLP